MDKAIVNLIFEWFYPYELFNLEFRQTYTYMMKKPLATPAPSR